MVLLYTTGNYIQYLVITCNGKELEKEHICMYVCMAHFAAHMKLMQYYKSNYTSIKKKVRPVFQKHLWRFFLLCIRFKQLVQEIKRPN